MRKKLTPIPKLVKKLDALWSLRVRERDNRCMLCGGYVGEINRLQAHHWIITRAQSSKYRWDLRNGVSLCYGCHIHQVHSNPSVELIERLKRNCVLSGIATEEEIEEIISRKHEVFKIDRIFVDEKIKELQK